MQRDLLFLSEMIDTAERARDLANGITLEALHADRMRTESLLWNFTVLGEAATKLSDEVKERFPDIPWQLPARLRNRIVHGYWSIDLDILHTTATSQLPAFTASLRQVLHTLTAEHQAAAMPATADEQADAAANGTTRPRTS